MSDLFTEEGWEQRVADARLQPSALDADTAGFFENALTATGQQFMRGGAAAGDLFATAGKFFGATPDMGGTHGEELREERIQAADDLQEELRESAREFWTPDARSTGTVGRVLGGLSEMALPLAVTGGNPAVLIGSQTLSTGKELVDAGVDSTTAGGVAAATGTAAYLGFKTPILGKTLGQRVFTGALGNTAVGMGATFAEQKILEGRGYEELAEQYDPLDAEGRTIDLLMGAAFGAIRHAGAPRMLPSERAAVLAAANARHFQVDTAPGRPLDAAASAAHQRAMEASLESLMTGEPVSVPREVLEANFEPRPTREATVPEELNDFEAARARPADPPLEVSPRISGEQADARLFDAASMSQLRGGDLAQVQNAGFVRSFLERVPGSERNAMLNPDGTVSQEGVRRIQAALLAKAYGGSPESNVTLGRMLESTDSDMRAAMGALLDAAPAFARLRQSITDGKVAGDYDIAPFITRAIEETAKMRLTGQSLRDFLAQSDMLTARPPIVDDLMKALFDKGGTRMAGREKIAGTLTKYVGQASKQRLDQPSLFAEQPLPPEKLMASSVEEDAAAPKVADMFGPRTPQAPLVTSAVKDMLIDRDVPVATGATDADGNAVVRSGREVMAEAEAGIAKAEADAKGYEAAVGCVLTRGLDDAA